MGILSCSTYFIATRHGCLDPSRVYSLLASVWLTSRLSLNSDISFCCCPSCFLHPCLCASLPHSLQIIHALSLCSTLAGSCCVPTCLCVLSWNFHFSLLVWLIVAPVHQGASLHALVCSIQCP